MIRPIRMPLLAAFSLLAAISYAGPVFAAEPGRGDRADLPITPAMRAEVLRGVIHEVESLYVDPAKAHTLAETLRRQNRKRAFDSLDSAGSLCRALTRVLREGSGDQHLRVDYSSTPMPLPSPATPGDTQRADSAQLVEAAAQNFGFVKVERLRGNVGLLELRKFYEPQAAGATAVAAMALLANTDALIIDLRENGGGYGEMVNLLTSYFLPGDPVHLRDIYDRATGEHAEEWTLPYVPGRRYTKPLYILTSRKTFSAAEAFTYGLKNQKRARIVGERTRGGAHPTTMRQLNEHFAVFVPHARVVDAVTGTDWEGTGVAPDMEVPAAEASLAAHLEILKGFRAEEQGRDNPGLDQVIQTIAGQLEQTRSAAK
jgi:hypothetical protein